MNQKKHYLERASYDWSKDSIRIINTPSATAKSLYFYMQETGYFKTKYPYFTERANLNSFLIVFTISGRGKLKYEKKEYMLHQGQCFFIHCMNQHYYETLQNSEWEFLWLHFNGTNALGYYNEFVKNGFFILDIQDTFAFDSTLRRIIAINQKKNISSEIMTSNLIINLLSELLIQTCIPSSTTFFLPQAIKETIKAIDKHFQSPLSLDLLANEQNINKFHLAKEFKKYTGNTVNEYIINTRLSYAKELLKYSDLPIREITYECGMSNVSHFINLFKSREMITPLAYRREWTKH